MKYTYRVHRDVWADIEIEADDEDCADHAFSCMEESGEVTDILRDELLEAFTEVAEVWEGGVGEGIRIYSIY